MKLINQEEENRSGRWESQETRKEAVKSVDSGTTQHNDHRPLKMASSNGIGKPKICERCPHSMTIGFKEQSQR